MVLITRFITLLFVYNLLVFPASCSTVPEYPWYTLGELHDEVAQYVVNKRFDKLTELGERIRKKKLRYRSGRWCLPVYYDGIGYAHDTDVAILKTLELWMKEIPDTNIPLIALTRAYKARAWKIRGNDVYAKLSKEIIIAFNRELSLAWETGEKAIAKGPVDPELLVTMYEIAVLLGKGPAVTEPIFHAGVRLEPTYYPLYYSRYTSLLPRWGGSEKALKDFAEEAVKISGESTIYARLAYNATNYSNDIFKDGIFNWDRTKKDFMKLEKEWPGDKNKNNTHMFCFLAMLAQDRPTMLSLFEELGPQWDGLKKYYFKNKSWYEGMRDWALTYN